MRKPFLIAAILPMLMLVASPARSELVTNGGFETGDYTGWTTNFTPPDDAALILNGRGHNGGYGVDFNYNSVPASAVLSQSLTTTSGTKYNASFFFGAIGSFDLSASLVYEVLGNNGTTVLDSAPMNLKVTSPDVPVWISVARSFTADGPTAILKFTDTTQESFGCDGLLDTVSVTAVVPEPSTVVSLCGLGVMGLVLALRRRFRKAA